MQSEIIELLESENRKLILSEISEKINRDKIKVSMSLAKLIKSHEVKFIEIDRIKAKELFGEKAPSRRLRLYYYVIFTSCGIVILFLV